MRKSYQSSQFRLRFNGFSRFLRAAYHETLYPTVDGRDRRITHGPKPGDAPYEIHDYAGDLKICPSTGLLFDDNILLKNSTDLFMRERVPDFQTVYDSAGRHFPRLISLRHGSEANYWHFFQLVATKVLIADRHSIDADVPVLLSRRQIDVPFVKRALERGLLGDRAVIVQEIGEVIAADRLYTIVPHLHDGAYRNMVLDRLGFTGGDPSRHDRVFVTRGRAAENNRMLQNEAEVIEALAPFGFEIVDPQTLDLDEQAARFAGCGLMVSPHGAGLTNMIFRRGAPLDIVEIFNFNLINPCYEIASAQHGFGYRALCCDTVDGKPNSGNPVVDVDELVAAVKGMLSASRQG